MSRARLLASSMFVALVACSDGGGPSESEPRILALGPNRVVPNVGTLVIEVRGTGFADSAVVLWDGSPRETFFDSETHLGAFIPNTDVDNPDTVSVQVENPDGRRSNRVNFIIAPGAVPSAIDSIVPRPGGEISPGAPVTVYLNEALDQSSLTDTSLTIRDEAVPVTGQVTYDATARTLTFTAPLAAARRFTARLSDELRSTGAGIYGARDWTFSTSLGPSVTLDSVAGWPSMVLGIDGRPRVAYRWLEPTNFSMKLKLAACAGDCTSRNGWSVSVVDETGSVGTYASLARDALGQLHYGYQNFFDGAAMYSAGGSQKTFVDGGDAAFTTITTASGGMIHLLYHAGGDLRAASCNAPCSTTADWTLTTVDTDGNAGSFGFVTADPGGGVHVTYYENDAGDLRYATCPAPCTTPAWTSGSVDTAGQVGVGSSLLVDAGSRLHATWLDATDNTVVYGTCQSDCTVMQNWAISPIETVAQGFVDYGFYYTSLALGPAGSLEASYITLDQRLLRGASCPGNCAQSGAWTPVTVSFRAPGDFSHRMTTLKVGSNGQRHVAWTGVDGELRYSSY